MADNWEPGDLALCVRDDWDNDGSHPVFWTPGGPRRGQLQRTIRVDYVSRAVVNWRDVAEHDEHLFFDYGMIGFRSDWFKKINPLTEGEEREAHREIEQDRRVPVLADGRHDVGYTRALLAAVGALRGRV